MNNIKLITRKYAKEAIEGYFEKYSFDKSKITKEVIDDFIDELHSDYESWIDQMLNSLFRDGNPNFEKRILWFE